MISILGVEIEPIKEEEEEFKYEFPNNFDEFNEYNIREEPNLEMRNYLYSTLSDAHYQRKLHLQKEFGITTASGEYEKENHHYPDDSEPSEVE